MIAPRILIAHDAACGATVAAEVTLLRSHGHEVALLDQGHDSSAPGGRTAVAVGAIERAWSADGARALRETVRRFRPAVVHIHGLGGALSPAIFWAAGQCGVPVVQTLHDFALACVQGGFLRANRVCQDCLGHLPLPAVRHACRNDTLAPSAAAAARLVLHRVVGTWRRTVSRFIVPSEFARARFVDSGLPAARIRIKPPYAGAPVASAPAQSTPRDQFVFRGPFAPQSGGALLAQALQLDPGLTCLAVGGGPAAEQLAALPGMRVDAQADAAAVSRQLEHALALVVPGTTLEPYAQAALEAFAHGLPVIGGKMGALPEIVREGKTGMLIEPGNAAELARAMRWARDNPDRMQAMGRAARGEHDRRFSAQENYRQLLAVYNDAIAATAL